MSFLVTRPPVPVPGHAGDGSMPCSAAMRATTGETNDLPFSCATGSAGCASGSAASVGGSGPARRQARRRPRRRCVRRGSRRRPPSARARRPPGRRGALAADAGEHRADVDRLALLDEDLADDAGRGRRHLGVDLVGRDLEQRLVGLDRVADLLGPLRDRALRDGDAHLRHDDVDCGSVLAISTEISSLSPRTTSSTCGMKAFSSTGENGTGVSGAASRLTGRVEVLERLLGDRRRDLGAEAAGARVLVQDEHLRGLAHRLEHGLLVPRHDRAQVDDLDRRVDLPWRPPRRCRPSRPR